MERMFALGGQGDGPLVPVTAGSVVTCRGLVAGERFMLFNEKGVGLELPYDGEVISVPDEWCFVSVSYEGELHPVFFVETRRAVHSS